MDGFYSIFNGFLLHSTTKQSSTFYTGLKCAEMCDFEDFCAVNLQKVLKMASKIETPNRGGPRNFRFTLKVAQI